MSSTPRLNSSVAGEVANFASVTGHAPELMGAFFDLYAQLWQRGIIADDVREIMRIRNARVTDCGY